jgi:CHAD domain-containing protein
VETVVGRSVEQRFPNPGQTILHVISTHQNRSKAPQKPGLRLWMERVLEECDHASRGFEPDPVHDLRVALRRCRSVADGLRVIDPDPGWKQMKRAGKRLFSSLGELRDVQIMDEWIRRLSEEGDSARINLLEYLATREAELKLQAGQALQEFDRKQWKRWSQTLPRRAARIRKGSVLFKHLALERWTEAHELHRRALRNQSQVAFHSLRIGIKRFRYIVENFLPERHLAWKDDLKELQDVLGEVHDLDVLWATALRLGMLSDPEVRINWHARINEERERRITRYREKMLGENSLWPVWRKELPQGKEVESAALARLKRWASMLDPDTAHSKRVERLAFQLYDGLRQCVPDLTEQPASLRKTLRAAVLLHDVGRSKGEKGHQKAGYRLILCLAPPLGWSRSELDLAAVIVRCQRGAVPSFRHELMRTIPPGQRTGFLYLVGILRLADALDAGHDGRIRRLKVLAKHGFVQVAAEGYSSHDRSAEVIAASRHLLETVLRRPILIRGLRMPSPKTRRQSTPAVLKPISVA